MINYDEIIGYYQNKLQQHGGSAQGMDWKNEETQYLRFSVIARYIDFRNNPTVLDIGCGAGEFNNFCKANKYDLQYTGLDIVPEMITITNNRFGAGTAVLGSPLTWEPAKKFDYVIASGTFNAKLNMSEEEWQNYFHDNIKKMFEFSAKAIIFNCMTCYVDYRYERLYYAEPNELSEFAVKNLSRTFIIDHSYPLYEMTMAVYKNQ